MTLDHDSLVINAITPNLKSSNKSLKSAWLKASFLLLQLQSNCVFTKIYTDGHDSSS